MEYLPHADGAYRTPDVPVRWWRRLCPSCSFYPRYASIVLRSGLQARRGRYDGHAWALSSQHVREALERVGVRFEVTGLEHLAGLQRPFVVASNHMSTLETMVLPSILMTFHNTTFVVKQSLLKYPLFREVLSSREPIAVTQTNPREDFKIVMEQGLQRLQRGYALIIFPEAARRRSFEPERFNTLAEKLAQRAAVPLIPLALKTDAWGLGWPLTDFGRIDPGRTVRFAFGPPREISSRNSDQHAEIVSFIQQRWQAWDAEDRTAS